MSLVKVVRGDCFAWAKGRFSCVELIIADPPYGKILKEKWDVAQYEAVGEMVARLLVPGGTAYVWGGIGKPFHRPFFAWLASVEEQTGLQVQDVITWKKKRAYGTATRFLFVREECAMLVKGDKPRTFNVPLLEKERGYAGYNPLYPAKSKYLRRTNVWDDVSELFKGKIHPAEKPSRLAEIMIETSSRKGDRILDPFAGSGSSGVAAKKVGGRSCLLIEKSNCQMHKM